MTRPFNHQLRCKILLILITNLLRQNIVVVSLELFSEVTASPIKIFSKPDSKYCIKKPKYRVD